MNTFVYMDRNVIKRRWSFNRTPLGRAGAYLMRIARTSIRRRKNRNKHSAPGTPPYSHQPGALPPFKQIFFNPSMLDSQVVIGMVGYDKIGTPVPGLQEHGGSASRKVFKAVGRRTLKRRFKSPREGGIIKKKMVASVRYPKRPFMIPALNKTISQLPRFWANSLK